MLNIRDLQYLSNEAENPWTSDAGLTHFDRSMINFYLAPILAFLLTNVN